MNKIFTIIFTIISLNIATGQGFINNGSQIYVSNGTYIVINDSLGSYTNDSVNTNLGKIYLLGTIALGGNWTNNVYQTGVLKQNSTGTVNFNGTSTQVISGINKTDFTNINIDSASYVVVNPGYLITTNNINNKGTLRFLSDSIQTAEFYDGGNFSNYSGNGKYQFERYISPNKWHYVSSTMTTSSSPVNGLSGFSVYTYYEPSFSWNPTPSNSYLKNLVGYDVKLNASTGAKIVFDGDFFTNADTISLSYLFDGWNMIGNPYPVTIDWDAASGWTKTNLSGGIYIWDPDFGPNGNYRYYIQGGGSANTTNQYIAPTQGFWVECTTTPCSVSINNNAKVQNKKGVFRNSNQEGDFIILKLNDKNNELVDQSSIRFHEEATEIYDYNLDLRKMTHPEDNGSQVYTITSNNRMVAINSMPYPVDNKTIPLNLKIRNNNNFTLSFDLSNYYYSKRVYLEDTKNNEFIELFDGYTYAFTEQIGNFNDRFILHFADQKSSSLDEDNVKRPYIVNSANTINIKSLNNANIKLFNVEGKLLLDEYNVYGDYILEKPEYSKGIYLLQIQSGNYTQTEKIIIN